MELLSLKQRFGIIGNSGGLNNALNLAMRVAPTNLSVLITGESGVGKEIIAQVIHALSPRKHNPYIAVNCGAIPEGTIDSELFGHEKGSFTGASETRKGYFESVTTGTILLDEIAEMPMPTQARLLRVLETGEFIKVGSSKVQKTDVRLIAATNVNLMDRIRDGKFREDLYYRIATVPIAVPPLRDRKEDIHLLFRKFASDFAESYRTDPVRLDDDAAALLISHPWFGNIRELKNVAEQLSILSSDRDITREKLASFLPQRDSTLPVLARQHDGDGHLSERELMYKVLFDMKKDLNDLKKVVYGRMETPDQGREFYPVSPHPAEPQPIVIGAQPRNESLSIADKEKELIAKALKKYSGRRKDAASDLGISERTLYRKIKEYGIHE